MGQSANKYSSGGKGVGGEARSFSSFMDAAQENALSRLYGGIHVRSSSEDGLAVGTTVGNYVFNNILTPVPV